jgi:hypothetical protein
VALASWEAFEQLQAHLVREHGFVDDPSQKQRLTFKAEGDGAGTTIARCQLRRRALCIN